MEVSVLAPDRRTGRRRAGGAERPGGCRPLLSSGFDPSSEDETSPDEAAGLDFTRAGRPAAQDAGPERCRAILDALRRQMLGFDVDPRLSKDLVTSMERVPPGAAPTMSTGRGRRTRS